MSYGKKGTDQYKPKLRRWRVIATRKAVVSARNEHEAIDKAIRKQMPGIEDFSYRAVPLDYLSPGEVVPDYLEVSPRVAYGLTRISERPEDFFKPAEIRKAQALDVVDMVRQDDVIKMYWRSPGSKTTYCTEINVANDTLTSQCYCEGNCFHELRLAKEAMKKGWAKRTPTPPPAASAWRHRAI